MSTKEVIDEVIIKLPEDILEEYRKLDQKCNEVLNRIRRRRNMK